MTFSIVARSDDGLSYGVAVASYALAVGSVVVAAESGVGAIATQANPNLTWRSRGLDLLRAGATAEQTAEILMTADEMRDHRQMGIIGAAGPGASRSGNLNVPWSGGVTGDGYAIQGNCLQSRGVVDAMQASWSVGAEAPFARRLLSTLLAGDAEGGDRRGRQSAALYVVRPGGGLDGEDDVAVNLRVDDHIAAPTELARLLELHELYFQPPAEADRVPVDTRLRLQLEELAIRQGEPDLTTWLGMRNLEMRADPDLAWVDHHVIRMLEERK